MESLKPEVRASIDWLTLSLGYPELAREKAGSRYLELSEYYEPVRIVRMHGDWLKPAYRGFFAHGLPYVRVELQKKCAVFVVSSQGFARGINIGMIKRDMRKWNISRVDYALDLYYSRYTATDCWRWLQQYPERIENVTLSYYKDRDGNATVYIGSRSSDRMLRIYDKVELGALRFEIEIKGSRARMLDVEALNPIDGYDQIASFLVRFADMPAWIEIREAVGRGAIEVSGPGRRKSTSTEAWLLNVVASSLAKAQFTNPEFRIEFDRRVEEELDKLVTCAITSE